MNQGASINSIEGEFFDTVDIPVVMKSTPDAVPPSLSFQESGKTLGALSLERKEKNDLPLVPTPSENMYENTAYRPEIIRQMYEYFFKHPKMRTITETWYRRDGEVHETKKEVENTPPHFSEFARQINVPVRIFDLWKKNFSEFAIAYEDCQSVIKEFLIDHGLTGKYSPSVMIFVAKNEAGMHDKVEKTVKTFDLNKFLDQVQKNDKRSQGEATIVNI